MFFQGLPASGLFCFADPEAPETVGTTVAFGLMSVQHISRPSCCGKTGPALVNSNSVRSIFLLASCSFKRTQKTAFCFLSFSPSQGALLVNVPWNVVGGVPKTIGFVERLRTQGAQKLRSRLIKSQNVALSVKPAAASSFQSKTRGIPP